MSSSGKKRRKIATICPTASHNGELHDRQKNGDAIEIMKEYCLVLNMHHMGELLEALRNHQVATESAPGHEQEKAIVADLCRRAELLSQVVQAGDNLREAEKAYSKFCEEGSAPTVAPVAIRKRMI